MRCLPACFERAAEEPSIVLALEAFAALALKRREPSEHHAYLEQRRHFAGVDWLSFPGK